MSGIKSALGAFRGMYRGMFGGAGGGGVAAAGGPNVWYYTTSETDAGYVVGGLSIEVDALIRCQITATVGGSLTKVAFKLAQYSPSCVAVTQVYKSDKTLIAGASGSVAITNNVGTWFEITLATPYTIANGELVYVVLGDSGSGGSNVGYNTVEEDEVYNVAWGSPPTMPNPITNGEAAYMAFGIKIYVD
jgi:hypothetical protein